ncbi:hypothetical protein HPC49_53050 [Pyxidicoccus fallax]|nr:hypothetical protein [Pyxidicoccus fallax]NPC86900.1 hypothetical protein [Pyxidicoccus fallax]
MDKLDILDLMMFALVDTPVSGPITVREGRGVVRLAREHGNLPSRAQFFGEFFIAKQYVHGRFTTLRVKDKQYPVCVELLDYNTRARGIPRLPGGDDQSAVIYPHVELRSVRHFERFD